MSVANSVAVDEAEGQEELDFEMLPAPDDAIYRLRSQILSGQHWFLALLDAVGAWRLPEERIGERTYRYLIGGEAFDWLLLAERLLDEVADIVPSKVIDDLLFHNRWPEDIEDDEFELRIGPAKHSAHLNFLYGVLVEEALQLSIEEEMHKERLNRPWGPEHDEEGMHQRVYGKTYLELRALHYEETGHMLRHDVALPEWKAFTYWLFRYRLRRQDKARVASDTRKGLAQLTRMELAVSERRRGASLGNEDFAQRYAADLGPSRGRLSSTLAR